MSCRAQAWRENRVDALYRALDVAVENLITAGESVETVVAVLRARQQEIYGTPGGRDASAGGGPVVPEGFGDRQKPWLPETG